MSREKNPQDENVSHSIFPFGSPTPVGSEPFRIAYDPVHQRMYVATIHSDNDTLSVMDSHIDSHFIILNRKEFI